MIDDLFKLTGQKPISMYDFVKLHAAEFTPGETAAITNRDEATT